MSLTGNLKSFSYNELKKATGNFSRDRLSGESNFGSVFKGWIDEQSFVAVKPGTAIGVMRLKRRHHYSHNWLVSLKY